MKLTLYMLLIFVFVTVTSFASITVKITNPTAYKVVNGSVTFDISVSSTYKIIKVRAKAGNDSASASELNYLSLANSPYDTLTLIIAVEDILHNTASDSVIIINRHSPPVVTPSPIGVVKGSIVHLHVEASHIDGNTQLSIVGLTPDYPLIAEGINVIDTMVDISNSIFSPGYQEKVIQVIATDNSGQVTTSYINPFFILTSPYLQLYHKFEDSTKIIDFNYGKWLVLNRHNNIKSNTLFDFNSGDSTAIPEALNGSAVSITQTGVCLALPASKLGIWHPGFTDYFNTSGFIAKGSYAIWAPGSPLYHMNLVTYKIDSFIIDKNGSYDFDAQGDVAIGKYTYNADGDKVISHESTVMTFPGEYNIHQGPDDGLILNNRRALYTYRGALGLIGPPFGYGQFVDSVDLNDIYALFNDFGAYTKSKNNAEFKTFWLVDSLRVKTRIDTNVHVTDIYGINPKGDMVYARYDSLSNPESIIILSDRYGNKKTILSDKLHSFQVFYDDSSWYASIDNYLYKVNLNGGDSLAPIHREAQKDSAYSFAAGDFDKAFIGTGQLFEVKITALPKHGTLYFNGKPVIADTVLRHAILNLLKYKPDAGFVGHDTIYWNGSTGGDNFTGHDTIIEMSVVEALPVSLLSFAGKTIGKANQLYWQTAKEINSAYFSVEKSTNGTGFTAIGTVTAKGNSGTIQDYEYLDARPMQGLNYYRLKIEDKDGRYSYSQIIALKNTNNSITQAYPNPAKNYVTLCFSAAGAGRYSFTVYNMSGKAVTKYQYALVGGNQNITLSLTGMASGAYIIKVADASGVEITEQKVIKE